MKRFQSPVSPKAFAREVLFGVLALSCFFAIFLYVALQRSTGKSLSPLSYLWPETENAKEDLIPVVVFRTEEDRLAARAQYESPGPILDDVMGRLKESTDQLVEKGKQRELRKLKERQSPVDSSRLAFNPQRISPGSRQPLAPGSEATDSRSVTKAQFVVPEQTTSQLRQPKLSLLSNEFRNSNSFAPGRLESAPPSGQEPPQRLERRETAAAKPIPPDMKFNPSIVESRSGEPHARSNIQQASFQMDAQVASAAEPNALRNDQSQKLDRLGKSDEEHHQQLAELRKNALQVKPESGDSFWSLSEEYYGDGKHFASLALFNGCSENIDDLPEAILIPILGELKQFASANPQSSPANDAKSNSKINAGQQKRLTTRGGENLFEIARDQLGSGADFVRILKANRSRLPENCDAQTRLPKGLKLLLPASISPR